MVVLQIAARRAAGSGAAPAVPDEHEILRTHGRAVARVPGRREVLQEGQQPHPRRHPPAADGKRPGRAQRRRGIRVGPGLVPGDRSRQHLERPPPRVDRRGEVRRQGRRQAQTEENVRAAGQAGGRVGGGRKGRIGRQRALTERGTAESGDPLRGRPTNAAKRGVPVGVGQRRRIRQRPARARRRRDRPGAAPETQRPRLVAQPLDARLAGSLDPRLLGGRTGRTIAEDSRHDQDRLEADAPRVVRPSQKAEAAQRARRPRPVLARRARQSETLLGVVPHTGEAQAPPGAALGHVGEQAAQSGFELVLEGD